MSGLVGGVISEFGLVEKRRSDTTAAIGLTMCFLV
jgi:hypothetical protein